MRAEERETSEKPSALWSESLTSLRARARGARGARRGRRRHPPTAVNSDAKMAAFGVLTAHIMPAEANVTTSYGGAAIIWVVKSNVVLNGIFSLSVIVILPPSPLRARRFRRIDWRGQR